jgi:hypothetical protein
MSTDSVVIDGPPVTFEIVAAAPGPLLEAVITEFYNSTPIRIHFSAPLRLFLLNAAKWEARRSVRRQVETGAVVVRARGNVVGGVLIGHRGTLFNASLQRSYRSPEIFEQVLAALVEAFGGPGRTLRFWTWSDTLMALARQAGFSETPLRRHVHPLQVGPLRMALVRRGTCKCRRALELRQMERQC